VTRISTGPDLSGRRVLVTGGSRGIGLGIVRAFLAAGADVTTCGRSAESLEQACHQLVGEGLSAPRTAVCDLADAQAVAAFVDESADVMGGLDTLINNASGFGRTDDEDGWSRAIAVDLMGSLRASWSALPWLRNATDPSIVHLSSSAVLKPSVLAPAYAAVKAGLVHYTRSQAKANARDGIRVNAVAPGPTTSPGHFYEQRRRAGDPGYLKVLADSPSGRLGEPSDIGDVVVFLASPAARWITGQMVVVDGGFHLFDGT
jgi:3-oxoacyl-[acyl-carrier protein] reductase